MRIPPRIAVIGGAFALTSALFAGGVATAVAPAGVAAPESAGIAGPAAARLAAPAPASITTVGDICYSALPSQAHDTLTLIDQGGPYPYEQDGTVFQNREGILPSKSTGYYHEYTVVTPGSPTRGAKRIVTGDEAQEDYYTADHYESFDLVDHGC